MANQLKINFRAERSGTTISVTFSPTPSSGSPPLTVSFTITSTTGEIDTYEWDFGDGDTFSGADAPDHTYSVDGVYTVTLTVTGPAGTASDSHNVTVATGGGGGPPYDNIVDAFPLNQDGLEHTKDFDTTGFTMETNEDTEGYDFPEVWAKFDLTDYPPGCVTVTFKTETISGSVVPEIDLWAVFDATFDPAAPDFSKVGYAEQFLGDGTTTPNEQTWVLDPDYSVTRVFYLWISDWNFDLAEVGVQRLTYTIQPAPDPSDQVLRADSRSGASARARKNFAAENEVWVTASVAFSTCAAEAWRAFFLSSSANLLEINYNSTSQIIEGIYVNRTGAGGGDPIAWASDTNNNRAVAPAPVGETWQLLELHYVASTFILTAYVDGTQVWTWDLGSGGADATGVTVGQSGSQAANANSFAYVNDVKVGTTRSGTEIFEDDFSSGDLSNWDVSTGTVDVGPNPFPTLAPPSVAGRWYSSVSAVNTQIPDGVAIHADSDDMIAAMVDNQTAHGSPWGPTISSVPAVGISDGTETPETVRDNHPSCNLTQSSVRFPVGFVIEEEFESPALIMYDDGTEWDFFKLTPPGVATLSSSGGPGAGACTSGSDWGANIVLETSDGWTGNGYPVVGGRASQTSQGFGLMRFRDLETTPGGTWDHALALAHPNTSNGSVHPLHVAPATGGDGTNASGTITGIEAIPMGARIQLDPSIDVDTWPSLTGSEYKRQLARTLQVYGAILTDTAGTGSSGAVVAQYQCTEPARAGTNLFEGINDFTWAGLGYLLPTDLMAECRVIDWDLWTGT